MEMRKFSRGSKGHYNDIDIKELIYRFKQYECLWNSNCMQYKDRSLRKEAWEDIANYFHKDVSEIKQKMKHLRAAYIIEKKKVVASSRSSKTTPHKPSLFYYDEMDFLDDVVIWRTKRSDPEGNNDFEFESVEIAPKETGDFIEYANHNEHTNSNDMCKIEVSNEYSPMFTSPLSKNSHLSNTQSSPTTCFRQQKRKHDHESVIPNRRIESSSMPSVQNKNHLTHLYNSFGKTIALHLQQLPWETAIVTMSDIHTILANKILECMNSTQNDKTFSEIDSDYSQSVFVEENLHDEY